MQTENGAYVALTTVLRFYRPRADRFLPPRFLSTAFEKCSWEIRRALSEILFILFIFRTFVPSLEHPGKMLSRVEDLHFSLFFSLLFSIFVALVPSPLFSIVAMEKLGLGTMWNEFNAIEIKAGRGYRENLSLLCFVF